MTRRREDPAPVTIEDVKILMVRPKSYRVSVQVSPTKEVVDWIPLSQLPMNERSLDVGYVGTLTLPEWLAREKGLV